MIQFGILGCARIGRRGMIEGIQASGKSQLAAIASRRGEQAREWASEFGIPRHYDRYEALLADPAIDAVYLPLPNELHLEYAVLAAAAGKHILCEKPLARDAAEAQQIVAACRRYGVMLMEAAMWRHHPRTARALQMVREGRIGDLRLVKMDFSFQIDRSDWRLDPGRGGGALFDLGCYGINASRLFTGAEPVEVRGWATRHSTGVDMTAGFQLRFENHVISLLDCSFECPYRNRIELVGTQGSIEFPDGVLPEPETELIHRTDAGSERIPFGLARQYVEQVKAFCTGIERGELPFPAEDGLANMRVLEAVQRSLEPA